jgi:hypothetical protein
VPGVRFSDRADRRGAPAVDRGEQAGTVDVNALPG